MITHNSGRHLSRNQADLILSQLIKSSQHNSETSTHNSNSFQVLRTKTSGSDVKTCVSNKQSFPNLKYTKVNLKTSTSLSRRPCCSHGSFIANTYIFFCVFFFLLNPNQLSLNFIPLKKYERKKERKLVPHSLNFHFLKKKNHSLQENSVRSSCLTKNSQNHPLSQKNLD